MKGSYLLFTDFSLNAISTQDLHKPYNMKLQLITKVSFIQISAVLIIPANSLITQQRLEPKVCFKMQCNDIFSGTTGKNESVLKHFS